MRAKSSLEQTKIELEARIRSLEYQLSEEVEKRSNAEVLYNKAREQLNKKEDQYTWWVIHSHTLKLIKNGKKHSHHPMSSQLNICRGKGI